MRPIRRHYFSCKFFLIYSALLPKKQPAGHLHTNCATLNATVTMAESRNTVSEMLTGRKLKIFRPISRRIIAGLESSLWFGLLFLLKRPPIL